MKLFLMGFLQILISIWCLTFSVNFLTMKLYVYDYCIAHLISSQYILKLCYHVYVVLLFMIDSLVQWSTLQ